MAEPTVLKSENVEVWLEQNPDGAGHLRAQVIITLPDGRTVRTAIDRSTGTVVGHYQ